MTESVKNSASAVAINTQLTVDIQYALEDSNSVDSDLEEPPNHQALRNWAQIAFGLSGSLTERTSGLERRASEITIRIVADAEMRQLNNQYRGKDKTTNVLSFPFENEFIPAADLASDLLGDIVICHAVVVAQAQQQDKTVANHYAHMVTHGILHLCGFDHQQDLQAQEMEALEAKILAHSNIPNPYLENSQLN